MTTTSAATALPIAAPTTPTRSTPVTDQPPTCPDCGVRLIEPPLHRPPTCPSCGAMSWAIRDGQCLTCRHARSDHQETK